MPPVIRALLKLNMITHRATQARCVFPAKSEVLLVQDVAQLGQPFQRSHTEESPFTI